MEEASHMNADVFLKVLVPLMGVNNMAVLGISTPDDEFNYYSELLELKYDNGAPLFMTIQIQQSCQRCIEKGIAASCEHMRDQLPPWKSAERQDKMAAIMGKTDLFVRENLGVIVSDKRFQFDKKWIDLFEKRPLHRFRHEPGVIYVGIDPSGGGDLSHYSIVSIAVEQMNVVVRVCLTCVVRRHTFGSQTRPHFESAHSLL
jgi:hypothetical protein